MSYSGGHRGSDNSQRRTSFSGIGRGSKPLNVSGPNAQPLGQPNRFNSHDDGPGEVPADATSQETDSGYNRAVQRGLKVEGRKRTTANGRMYVEHHTHDLMRTAASNRHRAEASQAIMMPSIDYGLPRRHSESNIFTVKNRRRSMSNQRKRSAEGQVEGEGSIKAVDFGIRDVDLPSDYFDSLNGTERDEEFKAVRAYASELFRPIRKSLYANPRWTTLRSGVRAGHIILIPVLEFRYGQSGKPDDGDQCLAWRETPEGILIIKMRPTLVHSNTNDGLAVRPFTSFGKSNPRTMTIEDDSRGKRPKLSDYAQFYEGGGWDLKEEPQCFGKPIQFYAYAASGYRFNKDAMFAPVFRLYTHVHDVPHMVIGEINTISDLQAVLELDKAMADALVKPMEKEIARRKAEKEANGGPERSSSSETASNSAEKVLDDGHVHDGDKLPDGAGQRDERKRPESP